VAACCHATRSLSGQRSAPCGCCAGGYDLEQGFYQCNPHMSCPAPCRNAGSAQGEPEPEPERPRAPVLVRGPFPRTGAKNDSVSRIVSRIFLVCDHRGRDACARRCRRSRTRWKRAGVIPSPLCEQDFSRDRVNRRARRGHNKTCNCKCHAR
jgi:hypothetical protein